MYTKVTKEVKAEFITSEIQTIEAALNTLEKLSDVFSQEDVEEIYLTTPHGGEMKIFDDEIRKTILALEDLLGIWA